MKKFYRVIAILLAAVLLLSGCSLADLEQMLLGDKDSETLRGVTKYSDMTYTHPDMDAYQKIVDDSCHLAETSANVKKVVDGVMEVYDAYDAFYTNYHLANIRYNTDLTDDYWAEEYAYCSEQAAKADAGLDSLYYALADSPCREKLESEEYFGEGYFDQYEGESIYDETFVSLMEQESALISRYYDLSSEALKTEYYSEEYFTTYGSQMAEVFVELVKLRQEIAAYVGYDSYPAFAYDFYHLRNYTPAEAESYLAAVGSAMSELYRQVNLSGGYTDGYCSERQTYRYVKNLAEKMGGDVAAAFRLLDSGELYDIGYGPNKYDSSFEVFLPAYGEPFIFMNSYGAQSDQLTFAHEFGHFCNDYVCGGSVVGQDVAEIHSQGMEYLSLCYGDASEELIRYKMMDSLSVYVEQSAYALFEHQVYGLTGEELTVENVQKLYESIGMEFGLDSWDWDSRDYVVITHFFTQPLYVISYVVSNDVAFQIYEMEKETTGAGLETYLKCLESEDSAVQDFVETYGLESPLAEGRAEKVAAELAELLG